VTGDKDNFILCFKDGRDAEGAVKRLLEKAGYEVEENNSGDLLGWDLKAKLAGRQFKVEVKWDKMSAKTGNIAVEYHNLNRDKPSGIKATKADLWVYVLKNGPWVCRAADLLAYFGGNNHFRDLAGGDNANAAMRLYKADRILAGVPFHKLEGTSAQVSLLLNTLLETKHGQAA
jgi:hypothetical protein